MKKIVFLVLLVSMAFSSIVEVKRSKVVITVNEEKQLLFKGDKITLKKNDTLCIIKGKGKLVIDNKVQISMKSRDKCYKNFNSIKETDFSLYLDGSEDSLSGMSRGIEIKKKAE